MGERWVYHYCAEWQASITRLSYYDGIAVLGFEINSMETYRRLKELIRQSNPTEMPADFTVRSLVLLGKAATQ